MAPGIVLTSLSLYPSPKKGRIRDQVIMGKTINVKNLNKGLIASNLKASLAPFLPEGSLIWNLLLDKGSKNSINWSDDQQVPCKCHVESFFHSPFTMKPPQLQ